ncbi:MAG: copper chaperone PCu(A)C [Chloroflexi bacterium]|nr:copper chaperone PCu(A)C [Chloroflexota bacterium]
MRYLYVGLALTLGVFFATACGPQATPAAPGPAATSIVVDQPWARAAMAGGNGAAYMILKNIGKEDMKLLSAASDVAQAVEIHQTTMVGGAMQMAPVKEIPITAGGQTELKPGGYHVMMIGLKRELKVGEKISVVLTFDKGASITVSADVKQQ